MLLVAGAAVIASELRRPRPRNSRTRFVPEYPRSIDRHDRDLACSGWNSWSGYGAACWGSARAASPALGLIGLSVFAAVGFGSYYLSRPEFETLYIGLNAQDVSRIGAALKEAGITFDVNSQGNAVSVRRGQTAQARMLLAEKGLPTSSNAGYELFDKMGSMGLTSFMQEITRLRALEGEIARTIQAMKGVKGARVHIVLPDAGSFRRTRQQPSASVIIRTENAGDFSSGAGDPASGVGRHPGHDHRPGVGAEHGRRPSWPPAAIPSTRRRPRCFRWSGRSPRSCRTM